MLSDEQFKEVRQDFADDWKRTNEFRKPDPMPPPPGSCLIVTEQHLVWEIVDAVCAAGGLTSNEILGRNQDNDVARYRAMAIIIASEQTGKTTFRLGKIFNRDHSTIGYHLKRRAKLMQDPEWREEYERVLREL